MNRMPRTFVAVVLSLALLVAITPVAQARPLAKPKPALQTYGWFDAALAWMSGFLTGAPAQSPRTQKAALIVFPTDGGKGGLSPLTGSCIDPNGCTFGGGGGGF